MTFLLKGKQEQGTWWVFHLYSGENNINFTSDNITVCSYKNTFHLRIPCSLKWDYCSNPWVKAGEAESLCSYGFI